MMTTADIRILLYGHCTGYLLLY